MENRSKLSRVSIRRVLFVSILIFGLSLFSSLSVSSTTISSNPPSYVSLTPHDPISITSDSELEIFPGTGTAEDPYLIDGYKITTTSIDGIFIDDTTKYFIVRNCYVDTSHYGIHIKNVADGTATVINNTCNNNYGGISLSSSGSSTVANNTCSNNSDGIMLLSSGSSTVANNTCSNNYYRGIYLQYSGSSTVVNNSFTNCGLHINDGTINAYLSYAVENNWVNGKKLGFCTNLDSTIISEPVYGQLILVNCNSVTVRDQILNSATTGLFQYSCTYSIIINNTCSNNSNFGILLSSSGSATVVNNTCSNNYWGGIYLWSSDFCVVTYNLLQENEVYGVYLLLSSDSNLIHHNTFVDNNLGGTSQAFDYCSDNFWYDTETLEGNYWSDWSGTGNYSIAGYASSIDLYPLDEPVECSTDETQIYFTFTLLIVLVPLLLIKLFSKKRRKID